MISVIYWTPWVRDGLLDCVRATGRSVSALKGHERSRVAELIVRSRDTVGGLVIEASNDRGRYDYEGVRLARSLAQQIPDWPQVIVFRRLPTYRRDVRCFVDISTLPELVERIEGQIAAPVDILRAIDQLALDFPEHRLLVEPRHP